MEALAFPHAGYGATTAVVTVSVGVATLWPVIGYGAPCAATLVELADQGSYEAKRTGRNRVVHQPKAGTLSPEPGRSIPPDANAPMVS